jgi:hypothetical protein
MYNGVISSTQESGPNSRTIFAALLVSVPMCRFMFRLVTLVAYSGSSTTLDTPLPLAPRGGAPF